MKFTAIMIMLVLTMFSSAILAQDTAKKQQKAAKQQPVKTTYTCPMHPSVHSSKPGKCAKCGMNLVKSEVPPKKIYTCSMHPDVTSTKPGKCPKCKMDLTLKEDPHN